MKKETEFERQLKTKDNATPKDFVLLTHHSQLIMERLTGECAYLPGTIMELEIYIF